MAYIHVNINRLDENAMMPTKAMPFAAGIDVYSTKDYEIPPCDRVLIDTRIFLQILVGYYG